MAYFLWGPKYDVGVTEFNNQHKKLIEILNSLNKAIEDKTNRAALGKVILELADYTKEHFAAEEAYMVKYEYPNYTEHKKEHDAFVEKVMTFYNDFKSKKVTLSFEISVFLKNWLIHHISNVDKQYREFFSSKGLI